MRIRSIECSGRPIIEFLPSSRLAAAKVLEEVLLASFQASEYPPSGTKHSRCHSTFTAPRDGCGQRDPSAADAR
jgi:hypothetical protein